MRLDVYLTPGELAPGDLADRAVVVIDVLRASSTIVTALAAGAGAIYPVASTEEAIRIAHSIGRTEVLLCGERKYLPIEGFDLGNSPGEFTRAKVKGKTLVMSTTNGTAVFGLAAGAERVTVGALLNLRAIVADLAASGAEPVLLCAGRERRFGLEDALCAGEIVSRLVELHPGDWQLNDGAVAAVALTKAFPAREDVLRATVAGVGLAEAGFEADIRACSRIDRFDVVPLLKDRQIVPATRPAA